MNINREMLTKICIAGRSGKGGAKTLRWDLPEAVRRFEHDMSIVEKLEFAARDFSSNPEKVFFAREGLPSALKRALKTLFWLERVASAQLNIPPHSIVLERVDMQDLTAIAAVIDEII